MSDTQDRSKDRGKDPRLDQESRLAEFRRVATEIAADTPTIVKIAINRLIRDHNPLYDGSSHSAGRAGRHMLARSNAERVAAGSLVGARILTTDEVGDLALHPDAAASLLVPTGRRAS